MSLHLPCSNPAHFHAHHTSRQGPLGTTHMGAHTCKSQFLHCHILQPNAWELDPTKRPAVCVAASALLQPSLGDPIQLLPLLHSGPNSTGPHHTSSTSTCPSPALPFDPACFRKLHELRGPFGYHLLGCTYLGDPIRLLLLHSEEHTPPPLLRSRMRLCVRSLALR